MNIISVGTRQRDRRVVAVLLKALEAVADADDVPFWNSIVGRLQGATGGAVVRRASGLLS